MPWVSPGCLRCDNRHHGAISLRYWTPEESQVWLDDASLPPEVILGDPAPRDVTFSHGTTGKDMDLWWKFVWDLRCYMWSIFSFKIGPVLGVNVGTYSRHGASGDSSWNLLNLAELYPFILTFTLFSHLFAWRFAIVMSAGWQLLMTSWPCIHNGKKPELVWFTMMPSSFKWSINTHQLHRCSMVLEYEPLHLPDIDGRVLQVNIPAWSIWIIMGYPGYRKI